MKKLVICFMIMLLFGGMLGIVAESIGIRENALSSGVAFADPYTPFGGAEEPPFPPMNLFGAQ